MTQPTLQEYQEAIQRPDLCFKNPDLRDGKTIPGVFGLPKVISGGFAGVFQIKNGKTSYAARCFLREGDDTEKRYKVIYDYLHRKKIKCIIQFDYINDGILVKGKWYPILKMEWLEGETLGTYVERNHKNVKAMENLAIKFKDLIGELHKRGISHGDLHDQNIMVVDGELKLIDYDAMFVPGLENRDSSEVGHVNYQHPERNIHHNGIYLDHFSEWVIYISLKALAKDPSIWDTVDGGDQCLLLRNTDYKDPENSRTFKALYSINDDNLRILLEVLKDSVYSYDLTRIPSILDEGNFIQAHKKLEDRADYMPEINMDGLEVKYSSGDNSWIWDRKKVDYKQFTGTQIIGFISIILFLLYILAVEGALIFFNLPDDRLPLIALGVPVFAILSPISYYMNNQVKERRSAVAKQRNLEKEIKKNVKKIEQELISIKRYKNKVNEDIKNIRDKISSLRKIENLELNRVELRHRTRLREIEDKEKILHEGEKQEISLQLKMKKERYIVEELRSQKIATARVPNFGIVKRFLLSRHGIRSAADFTDVNISRNLIMGSGARFRLRSGGSTVFWWLNPRQVRAIRDWQSGLIKRYEGKAPEKLSTKETKNIYEKFKTERAQLKGDEKRVRENIQEEKRKIKEEYNKKIDELNQIIEEKKKKHDQVVYETQHTVDEICDKMNALDWEINNLKHQIKGYHNINFINYMKNILVS